MTRQSESGGWDPRQTSSNRWDGGSGSRRTDRSDLLPHAWIDVQVIKLGVAVRLAGFDDEPNLARRLFPGQQSARPRAVCAGVVY